MDYETTKRHEAICNEYIHQYNISLCQELALSSIYTVLKKYTY